MRDIFGHDLFCTYGVLCADYNYFLLFYLPITIHSSSHIIAFLEISSIPSTPSNHPPAIPDSTSTHPKQHYGDIQSLPILTKPPSRNNIRRHNRTIPPNAHLPKLVSPTNPNNQNQPMLKTLFPFTATTNSGASISSSYGAVPYSQPAGSPAPSHPATQKTSPSSSHKQC